MSHAVGNQYAAGIAKYYHSISNLNLFIWYHHAIVIIIAIVKTKVIWCGFSNQSGVIPAIDLIFQDLRSGGHWHLPLPVILLWLSHQYIVLKFVGTSDFKILKLCWYMDITYVMIHNIYCQLYILFTFSSHHHMVIRMRCGQS